MKILIVEDDQNLANIMKDSLTAKSCTVEIASDGGEGSFMGKSYEYDAILLDYSLPKKDGLTICKEIRTAGRSSPIIFLSVTDTTEIKVAALNNGADDYLVKPFSFEELHARLRAIQRRPKTTRQPVLKIGDLTLDLDSNTVFRGNSQIILTKKEFGILEYLMHHQGILVSRALIMEHVWTTDSDLLANNVTTHIRNLRNKINLKNKPDLIRNIAGRGYLMSK